MAKDNPFDRFRKKKPGGPGGGDMGPYHGGPQAPEGGFEQALANARKAPRKGKKKKGGR